MKILIIGKEGRMQYYTDSSIYNKHEIVYAKVGSSDDELILKGKDADIILVDAMGKVSRKVIYNMDNLKLIHSEGVGFQGIDVDAARERQIYVCNCKGMNASAVAEQTLLLMLGLLRNVCTGNKYVRCGKQIEVKENYMEKGSLLELKDCTVGLIGFGDIAKETAKYLNTFGAKVVYYSHTRASKEVELEYKANYMNKEDLLENSDIVSLHLPVTSSTLNMVNNDFLSKMKKGSYIVNTSRGELIHSESLINAIKSGHIAGAGLDTIADEPVKKDNPILQSDDETLDKMIFSCHIGGITGSSFKRGYDTVWSNIKKISNGEKPSNIVNDWR